MKQRESFAGLEFDNWFFLGQENIVSYLKDSISKDALFQTLLFCGVEGLGKRSLALRIVMASSCLEEKKPCFKCNSCKRVLRLESENIVLLDEKRISIKSIRELKKTFSLKQSQKMFCIIDSYESLSMEAENALLKILEEPNPNIHFIILSKNKGSVLKTVLSRSLVFHFSRLRDQQIESYFKSNNAKFDQELIDFVSGRPGLANQYIKSSMVSETFFSRKEMLEKMINSDLWDKFSLSKEIVEKEDLEALFSDWISIFRKNLYNSVGENDSGFLLKYTLPQISQIIKNLEASKSLLSKNVNKKLILENVFLNI